MSYFNNNKGIPSYYDSQDADSYTYVDGRGFAPSPPVVTERRMLQWCSNGIGFGILFYIIFSFILPSVVLAIVQMLNPYVQVSAQGIIESPAVEQLVTLISGNLSLLLPFLLLVFVTRIPARQLINFRPFHASVTVPSMFIALGASVIGYMASITLSSVLALFGLQPVMSDISFPEEPLAIFLFLLNLTVIAPIAEEIVFRGVIMNLLRRFGDCFALLLSSLLFAAVHMNLVQMPNAFIMGLVIGYFSLCTGSLWTGVCIHMLNNALVMLLNGLLYAVPVEAQLLVMFAVYALYLAAALVAMLVLLRNHPDIFFFHRSSTLSTERKKYSTFFSALTMIFCLITLTVFTLSNIVPLY